MSKLFTVDTQSITQSQIELLGFAAGGYSIPAGTAVTMEIFPVKAHGGYQAHFFPVKDNGESITSGHELDDGCWCKPIHGDRGFWLHKDSVN